MLATGGHKTGAGRGHFKQTFKNAKVKGIQCEAMISIFDPTIDEAEQLREKQDDLLIENQEEFSGEFQEEQ